MPMNVSHPYSAMPGGSACCFCLLCNTFLCLTLVFFVFYYIFTSEDPKFSITDASLSQFSFSNTNNTLKYNFAFKLIIKNSNKKVGIYHGRIQVMANYRKNRFAMVNLTSAPFYKGRRNTTTLHALLEGQKMVNLGESDISQFNSETARGVYSIDVQLALQLRARHLNFKTPEYPSGKIDCKLQIPLSPNGTSTRGFKSTRCGYFHILTDSGD